MLWTGKEIATIYLFIQKNNYNNGIALTGIEYIA